MPIGTDVHGVQRMDPNDFSDPLTFHLVPPAGQNLHISCEISQRLPDRSALFLFEVHIGDFE